MKKLSFLTVTAMFAVHLTANAQFDLNKAIKGVTETTKKAVAGDKTLSQDDIISGLKEALTVGTNNSTAAASKVGGFFNNPAIKIPFPPEAIMVKNTVEKLGMKKQTDAFVLTLNKAAEEATKNAAPVFINAIKTMTITDGLSILNGQDNSATSYLNNKTSVELSEKFKPIIKSAIQKVEVTKYWNPIVTKYNRIPGIQKQNPDLDAYVTKKALDGLFKLLADEELKIRKDPSARVNDILKKVFTK